ncbi:MAG: Smr/MutS family protein [Bacteriovorax sp.]|nr:Smr/MutS family protein [Bacteriovorax sp.]
MALNLLNGNSEALELLDWSQLAADISSLSHFELTRGKLSAPPVARTVLQIQNDLNLLEDYLKNYDDYSLTFNSKLRLLPDEESSFKLIPDISKGKYFEARELHFLAQIAESYQECWPMFRTLSFDRDFSIDTNTVTKIKRNFVNPLRDFVDFSGNVSYERHPVLKRLYAEVLALENDLRISIQKTAKTDLYSSKLQLDSYDIINDRYVLAVRSDSYNSELGPIVSRSQSGMTLFVEPYEVREKGNKRIHLLSEIESMILKLTIELSKVIHVYANELSMMTQFVLEIDWLNTKATYSSKLGLAKPTLNEKFYFELNGVYHPLLKHPVKNNIVLNSTHKGLIISGPNTGGKTVALKSFTLSVLMVHMGLYVPATQADIHPVPDLYYFSHDHQNLAEGLSSFASESKYYLELLKSLGPLNLIIIDEIFNSTSSEEASALAIAFLDEVHHRSNSKVVLSTHHQVLKTFMHSRGDYVSAHVGYDFDLNRPTYKLILGEPGSSLAFKIFDNLSEEYGLKTEISERAKEMLDKKQMTYETLLQDLSQKKIDLDKLLINNRALNIELRNQKSSMEGTLYLEREKVLNEYTKKIKSLFDKAENFLTDVKNGKINNHRGLNNEMADIQSALIKEAPERKNVEVANNIYAHMALIKFEDISPDDTVFSLTAKKNVKVQNVNPRKKEVQIQHGALSVWVKSDSLRYSSGVKPKIPRITINVQKTVSGDIEVDCRGMRLEEFQKIAEQSIDEVITGEIPFVTIIHGHGDGILKNWLRNYLKKVHRDLRWENIEGNDGCTKIFI